MAAFTPGEADLALGVPLLRRVLAEAKVPTVSANLVDARGTLLFAPDRVDSGLVDRLLSKCTDHLSLLAAPSTLERPYDFGEDSFDAVIDILRGSVPSVVLDVPQDIEGIDLGPAPTPYQPCRSGPEAAS